MATARVDIFTDAFAGIEHYHSYNNYKYKLSIEPRNYIYAQKYTYLCSVL